MLDEYLYGSATRISPEAPVMVVQHQRTESVPGGAANVAKNIVALGGNVSLFGVIGSDKEGARMEQAIQNSGMQNAFLVSDASRPTTVKMRILADSAHQVLRVDKESSEPVSSSVAEKLVEQISGQLDSADGILFSDYLKGTLTKSLVAEIASLARQKGVKLFANPKPHSVQQYRGFDLISLNKKEAEEVLSTRELNTSNLNSLRTDLEAGVLLVTVGGAGMYAVGLGDEPVHIPAEPVAVFDTAGAGDTVIATVSLGLAAGHRSYETFGLAAHTSASVVKKVGVATPTSEDLEEISTKIVAV